MKIEDEWCRLHGNGVSVGAGGGLVLWGECHPQSEADSGAHDPGCSGEEGRQSHRSHARIAHRHPGKK